jgi:nucleoside-diphosphate-sugar epimerase
MRGIHVGGGKQAVKVLICGMGYAGTEAARQLRAGGHDVTGWVLSEASAAAKRAEGYDILQGDLGDASLWKRAGGGWDGLVYCPSSLRGGEDVYRHVFLEALQQALACGAPRFVFTSSTSVYGQDDGSDVTEESPAEPASRTSRVLVEAEKLVLAQGGCVLRPGGIYGGSRGLYLARLLAGDAVIPGSGERWVNQIHVADCAGAIRHCLEAGRAPAGRTFNAVDDCPVRLADLYRWLCGQTGKPMPPQGPEDVHRKRGVTNKRISNAALRTAGWSPVYPDFRAGYGELLAQADLRPRDL